MIRRSLGDAVSAQPERIRLASLSGARISTIPIPDRVACNPSIAADGRGFRAIVRSVNYSLNDGGVFEDPPGVCRFPSTGWFNSGPTSARPTCA